MSAELYIVAVSADAIRPGDASSVAAAFGSGGRLERKGSFYMGNEHRVLLEALSWLEDERLWLGRAGVRTPYDVTYGPVQWLAPKAVESLLEAAIEVDVAELLDVCAAVVEQREERRVERNPALATPDFDPEARTQWVRDAWASLIAFLERAVDRKHGLLIGFC